jgi:disulfide bond formation protein DsbB
MNGAYLLSVMVLLGNGAIIAGVFIYLLSVSGVATQLWKDVTKLIERHALQILLLVSATATLGSLYFSEILGFTPCKLCWFQRIFMYPMPILSLTSLYKKTKDIFFYTLAMSLLGVFIAGYHYLLQLNITPSLFCEGPGSQVSCGEIYFKYFGYITIPWMSFSAFLIIASVSWLMVKRKNNY